MAQLNVDDFIKAVLVDSTATPELLNLSALAEPRSLRYDLDDCLLNNMMRLSAHAFNLYLCSSKNSMMFAF